MITTRPTQLPHDYEMLMRWWAHRGMEPILPEMFPATGVVALYGTLPLAMSFLYLDIGGTMAMIEWTSTSPADEPQKHKLKALLACWGYLERLARDKGCKMVLSMVDPNGSEVRLMDRRGYFVQKKGEKNHIMVAKPLTKKDA